MNKSLDKSLLEEVALVKSGISEAFIEKDWFVTQVNYLALNCLSLPLLMKLPVKCWK
jgi:hypothetical protein